MKFAAQAVRFVRAMPRNQEYWVLGNQFLRCSTSVAANYRAACRGRSRAEFIAKVGTIVEEADESVFWLELMREAGTMPDERVSELLAEAKELTAIFAATRITALENSKKNRQSEIINLK